MHRSTLGKYGVLSLVVLIVATYAVLIVLFADTVQSAAANNLADSSDTADHTVATFTAEEMQPTNSAVVANLAVTPGAAYLDPQTHRLNQDLILAIRSAAQPNRREFAKGTLPGVFPVPLTLAGHLERWPFDRYHSGPIEVQIIHDGNGANQTELVPVTFIDHVPGLIVSASQIPGQQAYRLTVRRSLSHAVIAVVVIAVLITLALLALVVAIQTARNRRKFQPPMTTWLAAMLFAVIPLRNALPGAPPFGAWVDVAVVLWVILALGVAMLIYIDCWWRHLKPEPAPPPQN
jgi:hypothetical protein